MRTPLCTAMAAVMCLALAGSEMRGAAGDIVIYAADIDTIAGAWAKVPSPTAAGGVLLATPDAGWASTAVPIAAPQHYFEVSFDAAAATYHLWIRMRGAADSKWNESVWAQFDHAVGADGNPLWRIGTLSALLVNLEDCSGCGIAGWGWQDNAYWLNQPALVRFAASGRQTLRVQVREDGAAIDQMVLSPATWLTSAPGALKSDTTIVPKPAASPETTLVRHPYVQSVSERSAVVVWATRANGIGSVRYSLTNGVSHVVPAQSRLVPATVTGMAFDYYQHEATLNNLTSRSEYSYTPMVDGGAVSIGDTLVTAPAVGGGTVRFIAFGDSGVGSTEQRQLATRMTSEPFDIALHTGDVAYGSAAPSGAGGYPQLHSWFFDIYRAWLRSRPVFPAIGNHDDEASHAAPYRDLFVLPANGASTSFPDHRERYYSFDYGPIHVVVLDTELAFQSLTRRAAQLQWLETDLTATRQRWRVAVFHRSPYSAGGEHGSDFDVRAVFGPIFDRHHVDLALSGHEHDYERSIPIRETADGGPTLYVVTGGGGARLYPAATAWWTAASRSAFHYVRGAVDGCRLTLGAVGIDGAVFDAAVIDKCGVPPPPPPPSSSTAFGGTPAAIPGVVQAEHFDIGPADTAYHDTTAGNSGGAFRATDVDIQTTTDAGAGHNVGWIKPGEWLAYSAYVSSSRLYTVSARVASNGPGGTFHVDVDGVNVTGAMTIPNTGGHQQWTTISRGSVSLPTGAHRLRIVFDASGATGAFGNINYIRVD